MGFMVSLRSRNRSPKTIKSYMEAVDLWAVDRHTVKKPLILA
jgi:hypothetical protein